MLPGFEPGFRESGIKIPSDNHYTIAPIMEEGKWRGVNWAHIGEWSVRGRGKAGASGTNFSGLVSVVRCRCRRRRRRRRCLSFWQPFSLSPSSSSLAIHYLLRLLQNYSQQLCLPNSQLLLSPSPLIQPAIVLFQRVCPP